MVFPDGNTLVLPTAPAGMEATASLRVQLSGATGIQQLDFAIAFDDPGLGLSAPVSVTRSFRGNIDLVPSSTADDSQSPVSAWTPAGTPASPALVFNFERKAITPFEYQWFNVDSGDIADQTLTSPVLSVGSGPLTWTFQHFSVFETNFDGMVLEISDNGGPWTDVGKPNISPTYNTSAAGITPGGGNPLSGRQAFTGRIPPSPLASRTSNRSRSTWVRPMRATTCSSASGSERMSRWAHPGLTSATSPSAAS